MRRFFVPPSHIADGKALLDGPEALHLRKVLRLGPGDRVVIFDGTGHAYDAVVSTVGANQVRLDLAGLRTDSPGSGLDMAMAQGYLKDKKMDGLVRPLTELGLVRWMPFMARRSVPEPDARRVQSRLTRWRKLSVEALKQCRRDVPLVIEAPCTFEQVLAEAETYDVRILFWESARQADLLEPARERTPARVFLLIGPEGGFDHAEVSAAQARGWSTCPRM